MSQRWTPESHVCITDDGMVIDIKLQGLSAHALLTLAATFEKKLLCVSGKHEDFGKFEIRFEIPPNHGPIEAKIDLENAVLRIKVSPGTEKKEIMLGPIPIPINISGILPIPGKTEVAARLGSKPHPMLIYCRGCGKHFDIVVAKGAQEYRCSHCGKVQLFDLQNLVNQAMEQSQKMLRKKRGRR